MGLFSKVANFVTGAGADVSLEIENAVSHKLNDYIPLSYPIKFSTSEMLSYYFAKPSRLIYC